jgi:hypothetical protein
MASTLFPLPVLATLTRFLLESVATAEVPVRPETERLVADATPSDGVVRLGETLNTTDPEPVVVALTRLSLESVNTGLLAVRLVTLRLDAVAAPISGVTRVGEAARTLFPLPVFVTLTSILKASVATAEVLESPDRERLVPVAVPILGFTSVAPDIVGPIACTTFPDPVVDFHVGGPIPPLARICPAVPVAVKSVDDGADW